MPTPLFRIAAAQPILTNLLTDAISFRDEPSTTEWKQTSLEPDEFEVSDDVQGQRVLLIEDTWVTGSTPLSAAIAVRRRDPAAIALIPVARMVYEDAMTDDYRIGASAPIDFSRFPR
jgi:hypothetical protein